MKTILKIVVLGTSLLAMLFGEVTFEAPVRVRFVRDAHAIIGLPFTPLSFAGVARRTAFRTMAWTGAAETAAAEQQAAAAAAARAAPPPPPPVAAPAPVPAPVPSPPPAAAGKPLPLGTVVGMLPAGCVSTPVGGVDYYYCGGNFYRAVFQGNNLVYVTAQP